MKKIIFSIGTLLCAAAVFAGGIDNKSNLNTGYMRNASRNTETKRPEAVLYNISGTGFMDDGLYFNAGNQFVFKNYTNELNATGKEYEDDENVFFFPNFEAVYKKDNWAAFFGFGIFAGGGALDYKDGTAVTTAAFAQYAAANAGTPAIAAAFGAAAANHSIDVYSVTMGEILGGTYVLNDNISLSAAGRLLHGTQDLTLEAASLSTINGGDEIGYNASGYGFGGIFGVTAKDLIPNLVLSVQYQTITKLDFKFDSTTGNLARNFKIVKGDSFHNDLPAVLGLGVGYNVLDNLYVSTSFNYYFNKQADFQIALNKETLKYDDSWEIGIGADYQLNDKIGLSAGGMYSKQGTKENINSAFNPVLDSFVAGCGIEYQAIKQLLLTVSYMHCRYIGQDYQNGAIDLNKNVYLAAIGATFKPF